MGLDSLFSLTASASSNMAATGRRVHAAHQTSVSLNHAEQGRTCTATARTANGQKFRSMVKFKLTLRRQVVAKLRTVVHPRRLPPPSPSAPPAQFVAAPYLAFARIPASPSKARARTISAFRLGKPGRLVVDISGFININSVLQGISAKSCPTTPTSAASAPGQNTPTTVRVVIDPSSKTPIRKSSRLPLSAALKKPPRDRPLSARRRCQRPDGAAQR